jgi:hypothetical protein
LKIIEYQKLRYLKIPDTIIFIVVSTAGQTIVAISTARQTIVAVSTAGQTIVAVSTAGQTAVWSSSAHRCYRPGLHNVKN